MTDSVTSDAALAAVIDRIYQLATQLDGITGITEILGRATRSRSCGLLLQNPETFIPTGGWSWNLDQLWAAAYRDRYFQCDPTVVEHFTTVPKGIAYASRYDRDNAAFRETEFFTGWCVPQQLGYFAGIYTDFEAGLSLRLTFQGGFNRGAYEPPLLRQMEAVMPHLRRAVDINRRVTQLISHSAAFAAVLEQSPNAVILLNLQGARMRINAAAEALCGPILGFDGDVLRLRDASAQAQFNVAFSTLAAALSQSQAAVHAGFHIPIPRPGQMPLSAYLSPYRLAGTAPFDPLTRDMVMLQIADPEQAMNLDAQRLREIMGLTQAESRIAVRLGRGDGAQEIAQELSLSPYTVREHIKHIYARVGVKRQAEFVARAYSALNLARSESRISR